jgi:hypothetical protein
VTVVERGPAGWNVELFSDDRHLVEAGLPATAHPGAARIDAAGPAGADTAATAPASADGASRADAD